MARIYISTYIQAFFQIIALLSSTILASRKALKASAKLLLQNCNEEIHLVPRTPFSLTFILIHFLLLLLVEEPGPKFIILNKGQQ